MAVHRAESVSSPVGQRKESGSTHLIFILNTPTFYAAVAIWYALASLATAGLFYADKVAARVGQRRVPEKQLHIACLLGGWPGAIVAIRVFRHKNRKPAFLVYTALAALIHVGLWIGWMLL